MADFTMPSLGSDMDAGTLIEWRVAPGDAVHRGDVVAVVDTDKAAIEVECFHDGVIGDLRVQPGEKVPVGTVLATIGGPAPGPERVAAPSVSAMGATAPLVQGVSPLVRAFARERGVDLAAVAATVPGRVVHRADVERFGRARPAAPAAPSSPPPPGRRRISPLARRLAAAAGLDAAAVRGSGADGAVHAADVRRHLAAGLTEAPALPPSVPPRSAGMRRSIADLVSRANREIPHYYVTLAIDLAAATDWLRRRNRAAPVEERIVPAAVLLAATARAAIAVPELNGHWVDGAFRPSPTVNLGVVISLRSGGILVPVIPDAASLPVDRMMVELRDLVARARSGMLRSSSLVDASITVSNLGDQGVDGVLGVIYPPQVALVGFGAVADRPWAVDGLLGIRPTVTASLSADHRATDGAVGARFLRHLDRLLHRPEEL